LPDPRELVSWVKQMASYPRTAPNQPQPRVATLEMGKAMCPEACRGDRSWGGKLALRFWH
ncbi:MAG: hypothetical protein ACODAD_09735, partial [Planctomycetota bacterium]